MQLALVAEAPLEDAVEWLQGHPGHAGRFVARMRRTAYLFRIEAVSGKKRLIERALRLPHSAGDAAVTSAAAHGSAIYLGASDGRVYSFAEDGSLLLLADAQTAQAKRASFKRTASRSSTSGQSQALTQDNSPALDSEQRGLALDAHAGVSTAVTAIAANTHGFAATCAGSNVLVLCTHATANALPQVEAALEVAQAPAVASIAYGGASNQDLALLTTDGLHIVLSPPTQPSTPDAGKRQLQIAASGEQPGELQPRVLGDAHSGRVAAAVATGRPGEVATCGADGTLRLWEASMAAVRVKRTFSAPLTALAAVTGAGVIAVGATSGVVRIAAIHDELPVASVVRVCAAPIDALAACPASVAGSGTGGGAGAAIFAAICGGGVFVIATRQGGALRSCAPVPLHASDGGAAETPLSIAFAPAAAPEGPCLLISQASADVLCIPLPPSLSAHALASAPVRVMRVQSPLTHIQCAPATSRESLGTLHAVCADRHIRTYDLPFAAAAWVANKGRSVRGIEECEAAGKVSGARLSLSTATADTSDGNVPAPLLLQTSVSGLVQLRAGIAGRDGCASAALGDAAAGGVTAAAFDASARAALVATASGAVFGCTPHGASSAGAAVPVATLQSVSVPVDADVLNDAAMPLFDAPVATSVPVATGTPRDGAGAPKLSAKQSEVRASFLALQQRFAKLQARNAAADAQARVPRSDFAIDDETVAELRAAGAARVTAARGKMRASIAATMLACERMRKQCIAPVDTPLRAVGGVRSNTVVQSFAAVSNADAARAVQQLTFLRRVEIAECKATKRSSARSAHTVDIDASGAVVARTSGAEGADEAPDASAGTAASAGAAAADVHPVDTTAISLYSDWDLCTPARRMTNAALLAVAAAAQRAAFNKNFAKLCAAKQAAADKVEEGNTRLAEIVRELRLMGYEPKADEVAPLEVRDHSQYTLSSPPAQRDECRTLR